MWFPIALFLGICIAVIVIRLFLGPTPPQIGWWDWIP